MKKQILLPLYHNCNCAIMLKNERLCQENMVLTDENQELRQNIEELRQGIKEMSEIAVQEVVRGDTDILTGVFNRHYLHKHAPVIESDSYRQQHHWAILFIDIDNFKQVNDEKGHNVGDCLLKDVAKLFQFALRPDDMVFRYGGDEFVIILNNVRDKKCIKNLSNRLCDSIKDTFFDKFGITLSIGFCLPKDEISLTEAVGQADKAMYMAKDSGKGKVCGA